MYLDFQGQRLENQTEKSKKTIKKEVPSALPDSAQGAAEGLNAIPHSLGRGVGPLPTGISDCFLSPQDLFTPDDRTPRLTVPKFLRTADVRISMVLLVFMSTEVTYICHDFSNTG